MKDALSLLPNMEDRVTFLKERKMIDGTYGAVTLLKENGKVLEAAKLLRSYGRLEDAWMLLDGHNEHAQFVAECKLAKAKQLILESRDDKIEEIKELIIAVKPTQDDTRAEVGLLLGDLTKDPSKLRKSIEGYQKCGNVTGELAATHCYLREINLSARSTHWLVTSLRKLFDLINAVITSKSVEERQQAATCDRFYGIFGDERNLKVKENEGARIVKLYHGSKIYKKHTLEQLRETVVQGDLIPMTKTWIEKVRIVLNAANMKLEQCPDYIIGNPCSKVPSCQALHRPHLRQDLYDYVQNIVTHILLDDVLHVASESPYVSSTPELTEVSDNSINQFQHCSLLYSLIFPRHSHPRKLSENLYATGLFLKVMKRPGVVKQMERYVSHLYELGNEEDKRANSDLLLQMWRIYMVFGEKHDALKKVLRAVEESCQKQSRQKYPLGMVTLPNNRKSRVLYGSYMSFFIESMQTLYSQQSDVLKAAFLFGRFIGVPASRPTKPIIPSIANMVFLMELWITILFTAVAKTLGVSVYLPASYLAQMHFYDAVCTGKFNLPAVYSAVSQTGHRISGRLKFFVDLMCASGKYSKFDILRDALQIGEYASTGEAERTLILALVMVSNLDISSDTCFGITIRRSLQTIFVRENFPPRLSKCLRSVQGAKNQRDVTEALVTLLRERQDEYLYECEWQANVQQLRGPGLKYKQTNMEALRSIEYETLVENAPAARQQDDEEEFENEDREQLEKMAYMKERERAAVIFQKYWRRKRSMGSSSMSAATGYQKQQQTAADDESSLTPEKQWVDQILGLFVITETSCQICNVVFTTKQQADAYRYEEVTAIEGEEYPPTTPPTGMNN